MIALPACSTIASRRERSRYYPQSSRKYVAAAAASDARSASCGAKRSDAACKMYLALADGALERESVASRRVPGLERQRRWNRYRTLEHHVHAARRIECAGRQRG